MDEYDNQAAYKANAEPHPCTRPHADMMESLEIRPGCLLVVTPADNNPPEHELTLLAKVAEAVIPEGASFIVAPKGTDFTCRGFENVLGLRLRALYDWATGHLRSEDAALTPEETPPKEPLDIRAWDLARGRLTSEMHEFESRLWTVLRARGKGTRAIIGEIPVEFLCPKCGFHYTRGKTDQKKECMRTILEVHPRICAHGVTWLAHFCEACVVGEYDPDEAASWRKHTCELKTEARGGER